MLVSLAKKANEDFLSAQKRKHRQISRMIRHIRDQIHAENHLTMLPDDHTIEELVGHALSGVVMSDVDWQHTIYQTLQSIVKLSSTTGFKNNYQKNIGLSTQKKAMNIWQIKHFALRALATIGGDLHFKSCS